MLERNAQGMMDLVPFSAFEPVFGRIIYYDKI